MSSLQATYPLKPLNVPRNANAEALLISLDIPESERERLHSLNFEKENPEQLIIKPPEGKGTEPVVDKASYTQLLLYLTSGSAANLNFQKVFLTTLVSFAQPVDVLAALYVRAFSQTISKLTADPVLPRILHIIKNWASLSTYQFSEKMIESLHVFYKIMKENNASKNIHQIFEGIFSILNGQSNLEKKSKVVSPSPIPLRDQPLKEIFQIPHLELARQLTLIHSDIFLQIKPLELLTAIWGTKKGCDAEHINQLSSHFDLVSRYVSQTVIENQDAHERGRHHKYWVDVAQDLYEMRNYHGVFAIIMGLIHTSVTRMPQTTKFAQRTNTIRKNYFKNLVHFCDFSNDYENYRKELLQAYEPCIPFIACFQRDLIYVQEKFPNTIDGLINFQKSNNCYYFLQKTQKFQNEVYPFIRVEEIQNFFLDIPQPLDAIELMKLSQKLEPPKK